MRFGFCMLMRRLFTDSKALEYRASLELCRQRNAELLDWIRALKEENAQLRRVEAVRDSEALKLATEVN
jgi:hypothetical protein